ncbi:MAG: helix-turn-helix domain-containing protein [bacterium]|nr:helix-turn-helix domain-containing protein [bacterium]
MKSLDGLVTIQELANSLGVPVATIYTWRYQHQGPPGFRVGKHLRFRWSDIDSWIAQQREPV